MEENLTPIVDDASQRMDLLWTTASRRVDKVLTAKNAVNTVTHTIDHSKPTLRPQAPKPTTNFNINKFYIY